MVKSIGNGYQYLSISFSGICLAAVKQAFDGSQMDSWIPGEISAFRERKLML